MYYEQKCLEELEVGKFQMACMTGFSTQFENDLRVPEGQSIASTAFLHELMNKTPVATERGLNGISYFCGVCKFKGMHQLL